MLPDLSLLRQVSLVIELQAHKQKLYQPVRDVKIKDNSQKDTEDKRDFKQRAELIFLWSLAYGFEDPPPSSVFSNPLLLAVISPHFTLNAVPAGQRWKMK